MAAAAAAALKVPPPLFQGSTLPAAAAGWLGRLRLRLRRAGDAVPAGMPLPLHEDPLQEAGQRLRLAREERGLGLRQLAQQTRISTAVIEALERGWRDRLPEPAYLRTMLPLLERQLALAPGSLDGALPSRSRQAAAAGREPLLRRFTPGSIDVFTSWQGTLLYGLITLGLIQLLNLQQFRIASRGLHSTRPIPVLDPARAPLTGGADAAVLAAFPDLRPTDRAAAGKALAQLRSEASAPGPSLALGALELALEQPTRLEISSGLSGATNLEGARGQLTLPILPPFRLRLDPAPAAGAVRWNGSVLEPLAGESGAYRWPPPAAPRPAAAPQPEAPAAAPRP
jgi:transcriptional regulator with XRE-family HTH domain